MLNYVPTANVGIGLGSGTSPTGFSITSITGGVTAVASSNGPGTVTASVPGTVTVSLPNATGSYSGTVQVQNSGDDGTGPSSAGIGQGDAQSPIVISVTGTVVDNRIVTASTVNLGRQMAGANLSNVGGVTILTSTGPNSLFTTVSVAGTTFDGTITSGTASAIGDIGSLTASGSLTILPTSGEGLTGESPIPVPVNYAATPLSNRVVTATPVAFGLVHAGATLSGSFSLSTSGPDTQYTRLTVDNGTTDCHGMSVMGGASTLFNDGSIVDNGRTLIGTLNTAGSLTSTISLASHGKGLTGEVDTPVSLTYGRGSSPVVASGPAGAALGAHR